MDEDRAQVWYARSMRVALPFGVFLLVWNAVVIAQLLSGSEPARPTLVMQTIVQVVLAFALITQSALWLRSRRRG